NNRVTAFQNDDAMVSAGEVAGDLHSRLLYLSSRNSGETCHLTRMRRDDERTIASVKLLGVSFESVDSIGVHDQRQLALGRKEPDKLRGIRMTGKPGTDCDD